LETFRFFPALTAIGASLRWPKVSKSRANYGLFPPHSLDAPNTRTAWWWGQSAPNCSLPADSLFCRENTGKFSGNPNHAYLSVSEEPMRTRQFSTFPILENREFFRSIQGSEFTEEVSKGRFRRNGTRLISQPFPWAGRSEDAARLRPATLASATARSRTHADGIVDHRGQYIVVLAEVGRMENRELPFARLVFMRHSDQFAL